MKLGVVGLPNVGKSTLFNAITKAGAECANYPFCTIEPNVGVVEVPDNRLNVLMDMYGSKKIIPAVLEFVDIAGLVKGASAGEGLGNKFLSHIREVDAIVHVVRCFEDENITHVSGKVNPIDDIEVINYELILADLDSVTKRQQKIEKNIRAGDKQYVFQNEVLIKVKDALAKGEAVRTLKLTKDEQAEVDSFFLLSSKPVIYCANIGENEIKDGNKYVDLVREWASKEGSETIEICAKIEEELVSLSEEDRAMFADDLGIKESGLDRIIKSGYKLLGLISYITAGEKEIHAWTITDGTKGPGAAGKIHSDFERGFIRAEVVAYDDLVESGSLVKAKEKGKVRSEGKEYVVKDGDVILFRFNV